MVNNASDSKVYYAPGQMLFHVEHSDTTADFSDVNSPRDFRDLLFANLDNSGLADAEDLKTHFNNHIRLEPPPGMQARYTFSRYDRRRGQSSFSLFPVTLQNDQEDVAPLVKRYHEALRPQRAASSRLGFALSGGRGGARGQLRAVSPNWLGGGSPGHMPVGGPGSLPQSVADGTAAPLGLQFPTIWQSVINGPANYPVDVFVLDTLPAKATLDAAWTRLAGSTQHPLYRLLSSGSGQGLIADATRANVWCSSAARWVYGSALQPAQDFSDVADLIIPGHEYDMSDHGLFIAGIINDLAPAANLHLVEVLNHQGIGTLLSLAAGFNEYATQHQDTGRRAIINCSFTLVIPTNTQGINFDQSLLDYLNLPADTDFLEDIGNLLEAVFQVIGQDTIIVASAGNDSTAALAEAARYPAAVSFVQGVGALGDGLERAPYSNRGDNPIASGIMTRGEIKSVYAAAAYPDATANTSGYARWAGTSFATPIVSGAMARLCGCTGLYPYDARQAIYDTYTETNSQDEQIFLVTQ